MTTRDSNWLLSAGADGTLRRWNLQNTEAGAGSYAVTDHEGPISELALSADGNRLLSGGQDKKLRVWRIDPTGVDRAFSDVGHQYRSVVFVHDAAQREA